MQDLRLRDRATTSTISSRPLLSGFLSFRPDCRSRTEVTELVGKSEWRSNAYRLKSNAPNSSTNLPSDSSERRLLNESRPRSRPPFVLHFGSIHCEAFTGKTAQLDGEDLTFKEADAFPLSRRRRKSIRSGPGRPPKDRTMASNKQLEANRANAKKSTARKVKEVRLDPG